MKCPNCDKKITNERIRSVKSRQTPKGRETHKVYCNNSCFIQLRSERAKQNKTCGECGEVKSYVPHANTYGIRRCAHCSKIAVSSRRLDSEVKSLVMMNPGAGFSYFIHMVFDKTGKSSVWLTRPRLTLFLQDLQEVDGIDYVGWLQNPDTMRVIKQEDVPTEMQKYMRGQRRSVPSGHVRRKRIRDGEPTREDGSASVKIPPEFRWGKYKPL